MCIDYRLINKNMIINQYPMPCINDLLDCLSGSTIFLKLDLESGYHLEIKKGHEHYTAFQSRLDLYKYWVVPFRLCNMPATF